MALIGSSLHDATSPSHHVRSQQGIQPSSNSGMAAHIVKIGKVGMKTLEPGLAHKWVLADRFGQFHWRREMVSSIPVNLRELCHFLMRQCVERAAPSALMETRAFLWAQGQPLEMRLSFQLAPPATSTKFREPLNPGTGPVWG